MKQIIFVEAYPEVMMYKLARLFKKKGYHTISIRVLKSKALKDDFYKEAFDKIISFNLEFSRMKIENIPKIAFSMLKISKDILKSIISINKLNPYLIICRTSPNWLCAMIKIFFKKHPLIYFPYDIRATGSEKKQEISFIERNAEKYSFEHSDGVLHKGAQNELESLYKSYLGNNLKITPLQLSFNPYCSSEFIAPLNKNKISKKDKEIHIVTVGSCGSIDTGGPTFLLDYAKALAKQKIHLHAYIRPNIGSSKEVEKVFKNNFAKELDFNYFHWHEPLKPKELIKEISKYDYAIMMINMGVKLSTSYKFLTGNQVSSYLEAGLPFFYSKEFEYLDKLMKQYKLDLTYKNIKSIENIKQQIKKFNYKILEKRVLKARKDYSMEKNFPRLEKFVEEVSNKQKNR